jgi:putative addiction module CopG family antidote
MTLNLPAELQAFIDQELAAGRYGSPEDVVIDALGLLRESLARRDELRRDIRERLASLEGGVAIDLADDAALEQFLAGVEAEAQSGRAPRP